MQGDVISREEDVLLSLRRFDPSGDVVNCWARDIQQFGEHLEEGMIILQV